MTSLLPPHVHGLLDDLVTAEVYDPLVVEIERRAEAANRPIPGRAVGRHLEVLLTTAGITDVIEFDAGFGALTYWLARAVGPEGQVQAQVADAEDARVAEDLLRRAGTFGRVQILHATADAPEVLAGSGADTSAGEGAGAVVGDVAVGQPHAAHWWQQAADRVRVGGLLILLGALRDDGDGNGAAVGPIVREVVNDPRFVTTLTPLRDGVLVARRIPDEAITLY